jgi:hypothetical protein
MYVSIFGIQHETAGVGPGRGAGTGASSSFHAFILVHVYLQIGDAGQDLVEHTCASASALHVPSRLGRREVRVVVVVVRLQTESDLPARRTSTLTCLSQIISRAHVQILYRSERAFVVNVACVDWQGSKRDE